MAELKAKRCWAFFDCPAAAVDYYGTTAAADDNGDNIKSKGLCASWQEARIYADPRVMGIDSPTATASKTAILNIIARPCTRCKAVWPSDGTVKLLRQS